MYQKNKERRERSSPDSTPLAHPTILLPVVANAKTGTNDNPSECKKSVQSGRSTIKISNSSKDRFNGMHCIQQKLINDGLSKESIYRYNYAIMEKQHLKKVQNLYKTMDRIL